MDILLVVSVLIIIFLVSVFYFFSIYNRLKSLRNAADATLSQTRVAMKKRLDVIEQLVEAVKSYAKFEKDTFEKITSLRVNVGKAGTEELKKIDGESRGILGNIIAVAETLSCIKNLRDRKFIDDLDQRYRG